MSPVIKITAVHYPESDGKPMGETDEHRDAMVRHIELLQNHYHGQRVYVSGNLLVYYEQGNPKKFVVPDAMVVKDIDPRKRRIYKIWVERKVPDVVIETTSHKTKRQDTVTKPELYAKLGIKEYFLFDPTQDYLDPPLQGQRLVGDKYEPIEPDEKGALISQELGLRLQVENGELAFYRLDTGERVRTNKERAEIEKERAEIEKERAEIEKERAEIEKERAETEKTRAETEKTRAETEKERAEAAAARAAAAEAEAARLREQLRRLGHGP